MRAHDLTLRGLFGQLFVAVSNIDGRLLRSFRALLIRPGSLTAAFVRGQRMPYIGPFKLFLIANVAFFAMQSLTRTNIVSSSLESHLHHQDWSAVAGRLVSDRVAAVGTTVESYTPLFDRAVVLNAKTLIILMTVPFALLLPMFFHGSRRPFVTHAVFSLHFFTFSLLLFCVSLAISALDARFGGAGLRSTLVDHVISVVNLLVCGTYLYFATGTVYGAAGAARMVKVTVLAAFVATLLQFYRFGMFLLTLYTT